MSRTRVYNSGMIRQAGWGKIVWAAVLTLGTAAAQTLNNQALNGKYFFRQVSLGTDAAGNLTDPRSVIGTMTLDGNGHYTFSGQQVQGNSAPATQTGSGAYAVDPAGFVTLDSPLRSGAKVNARVGQSVLLGSATETADNTFDLLVAIPAPASAPVLNGPYWTATLEFSGGSAATVRNTFFSLNNAALGKLTDFSVTGHAANLSEGRPLTQQVTGASYLLPADGNGSLSFGAASAGQLLSGSRTMYLSADGNVILGGSTAPGAHDILIGVKASSGITNATWNADFWGAGLRWNPSAQPFDITGYAGAVAARGAGKLTWTKRYKALGFGAYDFTGINAYALNGDGSGTMELTDVGLGAGGKAVVGSAISPSDPGAFEVFLGVQMPALSGSGVFLNPQKIQNAAGFAPAGNPITPGEFVALVGTNLAKSNQTASPPYPATLNGVNVLINNKPAPIYFVSPGQINCLVPYATQGPTATIVVQNGGVNSNSVMVPVAATSPGIFALNSGGSGPGAILHADYSVVSTSKPAAPGETVLIFLTGMGAVDNPVPDGTAGGTNPLSRTTATPIYVLVGGEQATILYSGLAPGFPGLYQLNVTLPPFLQGSGSLPVAIQTPNAFHDQVDIIVP